MSDPDPYPFADGPGRYRVTFIHTRHGTKFQVTVQVPHASRASQVAQQEAQRVLREREGQDATFHASDWHVLSVVRVSESHPTEQSGAPGNPT